MVRTRPPLPDFENPPVIEVVLSVQFEPIDGFRQVHLGLLWAEFRDKYPHVEEHPPLAQVTETFGIPEPAKIRIQVVPSHKPSAVRCWFLNDGRTELIQVQHDRFIHNWRKVGEGVAEGGTYPRYEYIRDQFEEEIKKFQNFLNTNNLDNIKLEQCEITYINHIMCGAGWKRHSDLYKVFTLWSSNYGEDLSLEMESSRFASRFIIPLESGEPAGRLHISLEPAFHRADNNLMFILTLTARGRPFNDDVDGALRFMDEGRISIVRGFTAITTPRMHKIWKRKNGGHSS